MRRPACAFALAGALALAAPASAAGPAWLEPVALSGAESSAPAVALAAPGDAAGVWTRAGAVEGRIRAPGAPYGSMGLLSDRGTTPAVDFAPDGTALAAWAQGASVAFAVRAPAGGFGPAQLLRADGRAGDVTEVQLEVNRSGDALIAYAHGSAFASTRGAGGTPSDPVALSTGPACDLGAAFGAGGQAAVVWRDCGSGGTPIHVARSTGSGFATSEIAAGSAPAVAVDADGTTVVAFESAGRIRAAAAAAGSSFGEPRAISDSEGISGSPSLAAASDGVWAAWRVTPASRIVAARRPTGQDFLGPQTISPDGVSAERPALTAGADGSVVGGWIRQADGLHRVEFARRAAGAASFSASGLVSAAAPVTTSLDLDADDDGNVLAGYLRGGVATVQTLDAAGPRLLGVDVREAGHALDVYPFAVDAADAWSGVASTAFDFGDGTRAAGPRAEHAFPSQGEWIVTVSATDGLGNVTSAARRFVAAPPLDRTAPVITDARMTATRFKRSRKETAVVARARRGTRFRYTLSEPSQVNIFFERVLLGRNRGGVCRRGNRRGKRCRIYEPTALITRSHKNAGPVSTRFTGRIVGRSGPLKVLEVVFRPGRYRATIVASDANRNVSVPVQLAFTVLR